MEKDKDLSLIENIVKQKRISMSDKIMMVLKSSFQNSGHNSDAFKRIWNEGLSQK